MALHVEPKESLPLGVSGSVGNQSQGETILQETEELKHIFVQTVCLAGVTGKSQADAASVNLRLLQLGLESLADAGFEPFPAMLCHAVLMYVEEPTIALGGLRSVAADGAVLSLLEKNRDGLALAAGAPGRRLSCARRPVDDIDHE